MTQAVKLISETAATYIIGGYGVVWGGKDLVGDHFTAETDFWFDRLSETPPVLYDHGMDGTTAKSVLGAVVTKTVDADGLWIEAQLEKSREYVSAVMELVKKGALGWSSGAVSHLVERTKSGWLSVWPVAEFSLTATPCEPRTLGVEDLSDVADDPAVKDIMLKVGRVMSKANQTQLHDSLQAAQALHSAVCDMGAKCPTPTPTPTAKPIKAVWSASFQNDLPDASFLYIDTTGKFKDKSDKTVPRSARHFPYADADGKIDLPHLRNAIARIPQSNAPGLTDAKKTTLQKKAQAMLDKANAGKSLPAGNTPMAVGGDLPDASYEALIADLGDLARTRLTDPTDTMTGDGYVVSTYPDYFVYVDLGEDIEYYRFAYHVDPTTGALMLDESESVEPMYVATPEEPGEVMPNLMVAPVALASVQLAHLASVLAESTKGLSERRAAENRPLSAQNVKALSASADAADASLAALRALIAAGTTATAKAGDMSVQMLQSRIAILATEIEMAGMLAP